MVINAAPVGEIEFTVDNLKELDNLSISKKGTGSPDILNAIEKLLGDEKAKSSVEAFRKQLSEWNGPENAARFLFENYG